MAPPVTPEVILYRTDERTLSGGKYLPTFLYTLHTGTFFYNEQTSVPDMGVEGRSQKRIQ